jgi:phosphoserine phosphatase RsbU/P
MSEQRRSWQAELAIIDRTMKAISSITDPEELVETYWGGIGELIELNDYLALSRRNIDPPFYIITRSSRFTEHYNPFTQREHLPRLSGGLLGEIAYANRPLIIEELPQRLSADDPARYYLDGFQALFALPQYDGGEALNTSVILIPPGVEFDRARIPMMHWQAGLFGRGTTNLVLRNQLSDTLSALDRELQIVGAIQRSLLPPKLPNIQGFQVAAYYQTSARHNARHRAFAARHAHSTEGAIGIPQQPAIARVYA